MSAIVNVVERVASTFIFTFTALAAVGGQINLGTVSWADDAKVAGGAAVLSLSKNVLAYFATQGNGPDVASFNDGGADVAPVEPVDPGVVPA